MSTSCLPEHDVLDPGNGAIGARRRPEHAQLVGTPILAPGERDDAEQAVGEVDKDDVHAEPAERASPDLVDAPTATSAIHLAYATALFFHNLSESERIGDHRIHPTLLNTS